MDRQAEIKAARTRLRMSGEDMAEFLGLKSRQYYFTKERALRFSDDEKAKLTRLFKWNYEMMNGVLYGGALPEFNEDGSVKE